MAKQIILSFVAGFIATLVFHQPVLWLLHLAGVAPRAPYSMNRVPPFGVPSVISLAFWGGVWGIILIAAIARIRGQGAYYLAATIIGAFAPTLVAWFVVAPIKHQPMGFRMPSLLIGPIVNAAWGLGTAVLYQLSARSSLPGVAPSR
ncbi:MAG TPA: hypothetical protein VGS96_18100 [Thermoanaerobaculia bacterium]|jgi:hypothetical protein|nr:hypothetical protein [Thermoanaerobaculia bacterium]